MTQTTDAGLPQWTDAEIVEAVATMRQHKQLTGNVERDDKNIARLCRQIRDHRNQYIDELEAQCNDSYIEGCKAGVGTARIEVEGWQNTAAILGDSYSRQREREALILNRIRELEAQVAAIAGGMVMP